MSIPLLKFFGAKGRRVDVNRDCYAMATVDGDNAEIVMYGEIVEDVPCDWWSGNPIQGCFIVLREFMDDLGRISGAKNITIRMNSVGGEVYAALPIHNRLRELEAHITVIVDGVAMSAASFIMCAADMVKVNAASIVMIHKASAFLYGGYNADEMKEMAGWLDTVDKALVSAYVRKTGMGEDEILSMMSDTTYMTGQEAIDKGFADELSDGEKLNVAASADGWTLYFNGRAMRLSNRLSGLPEGFPRVSSEADGPAPVLANISLPAATGGSEGGFTMAKTMEELRKENPELADALMADARAAASSDGGGVLGGAVIEERNRLQEIDGVAALFDSDTVREAKYGANACSAQEMAYRAALKAAKEGLSFMSNLAEDNAVSGAQLVGAVPGDVEDAPGGGGGSDGEKAMADARREVKTLLNKEKKGE